MSRAFKGRFAVALGSAMLLASLTVGSVLAGEVTGRGNSGQPTPIAGLVESGKLHSICAFSGQNDGEPPEGRTAEHVQNWGQISKADRDAMPEAFHPGNSCNGSTGFLAGGGGE